MPEDRKRKSDRKEHPKPAGSSGPSKKPLIDCGMPILVNTSGKSALPEISVIVTRVR